jgi:hypothetical protein
MINYNLNNIQIIDNRTHKICDSSNYNSIFSKRSGFFVRWGATKEEDPIRAPFPEILDIEISSVIDDNDIPTNDLLISDNPCQKKFCRLFCYKNSGSGKRLAHMSLRTFKALANKFSHGTQQIAFGICQLESHPELWDIFEETRLRGIIPNVTINQKISNGQALLLSQLCGAVAVSVNNTNYATAYDTIKTLSQDYGMSQVNIHYVLSNVSINDAFDVLNDIKNAPRLSKLNAIVFLKLKPKGAACGKFSPPSFEQFSELVRRCEDKGIRFGFDSCSAHDYLQYIQGKNNQKELEQMVEPCESGLFSWYVNYKGFAYPCSFAEDIEEGINLLEYDSMEEVWNSDKLKGWREKLLKNFRRCPIF